jgi:kynurenine formamidase
VTRTDDNDDGNFREIGRQVSNWGRWGADDERGTLNYITPETVRAGAGCVRTGKVFELSLPLGSTGPQVRGDGVRFNPIHRMTMLPEDIAGPDGLIGTDDIVIMPLQCATQWDSLAHIGYDGRFYNDVEAQTAVTAMSGAVRNGIDQTLPGVVGRGVLLDIARLRGVEWILADDDPITSADLDAAAERQAVEVRTGDALLVRTGWRRKALVEGWSVEWLRPCPGLGLDAVRWLHERQVAALAADNPGVERLPSGLPGARLPVHCVLIRDMGLQIGEMFDLEALAEDCAADGQWDFFFSAPPLRVTGAVGSTASPIAVK